MKRAEVPSSDLNCTEYTLTSKDYESQNICPR